MSGAELAVTSGLHRVGARPTLRRYLKEAWARRDFAVGMARYRIEASNQVNRLGVLWILIQPIINAAVYGLIFGLLQGKNRPHDYISYVVIGVFMFQFFSGCTNHGAKSIISSRSLVQSLAFPRITLPVATVIQNFISLLATIPVMLIIVIAFGARPHWDWFLFLPLLVLFFVFCTGVALISARLTVMLTDLAQLLPFIVRLLFYSSGVLFQIDKILKGHPTAIALFDFHPIYEVISLARGLFMTDHAYHPMYWLYFTVWAVVVCAFGVIFFWVAEERYGRVN